LLESKLLELELELLLEPELLLELELLLEPELLEPGLEKLSLESRLLALERGRL
jgi:hypothetical protein